MKIAICLLTCDRYAYTKRTIDSLLLRNQFQLSYFDFYYGDDASENPKVRQLADDAGFKCMFVNKKREGCSQSTAKLLNAVAATGKYGYIIYVQNDFECIRPIPVHAIHRSFLLNHNVGAIRLYGDYKTVKPYQADPIGTRWLGVPDKPEFKWKRLRGNIYGEELESARCHVGLPPFVIRGELIPKVFKQPKRTKDINMEWAKTNKSVGRFIDNVFNHIGFNKTPKGKWGRPKYDYNKD